MLSHSTMSQKYSIHKSYSIAKCQPLFSLKIPLPQNLSSFATQNEQKKRFEKKFILRVNRIKFI